MDDDPQAASSGFAAAVAAGCVLQEGQKAIFHLEAFAAKFMSLYKNFMLTLME
jgi:hypothetical protein